MFTEELELTIKPTTYSRLSEIDFNDLPFGRVFSDHMLSMDYKDGEWQAPVIEPFKYLQMNPATSVLHYGQSIFEGMKAYKTITNEVLLFRPDKNFERFNLSAIRMCMPEVPESAFREGLNKLIEMDKNWVPNTEGGSLYIRPFMFATDEYIGVKPSKSYRFIIFTCPVNAYYSGAVKVMVETHYSRSVVGGTGFAKASGNYAGALYPAKLAQEKGYNQLIWTDAIEHKYIEESGTMNIMFRVGNRIITPSTGDSILSGVTRNSILQLAKDWGYEVEERRVEVAEMINWLRKGELEEAFGAGTAATIAPIELIGYEGEDFKLSDYHNWEFAKKAGEALDGIKRGTLTDTHNWTVKVC